MGFLKKYEVWSFESNFSLEYQSERELLKSTMLDDTKKVGIGLIVGGMAFTSFGIMLFLNSRLIAIGNAMFMSGLCFIVGLQGTIALFTR